MTIRLLPNRSCSGCGDIRHVESKTLLCCYCFGLALAVAERKKKLEGTLRQKFLKKAMQVRLQLKEFQK